MMRSMFSGVSGLKVHQTRMDVIANNISNVNTTAYKSSRTSFSEVFSQTLSGASGPNAASGRGGVNAMQIGLGVGLASIEKVMTQGASQRTDRGMDLMIQGEGFFIVGDANSQYFTRAGTFDLDPDGNLYMQGNGLKVYGWDTYYDTDAREWKVQKGLVQPIVIDGEKQYAPPQATSDVLFEGNLRADEDPRTTTMDIYDSLGNRYTVDVTFTYDATMNSNAGGWIVKLGSQPAQLPPGASIDIEFYPEGDRSNPIMMPFNGNAMIIEFGTDGLVSTVDPKLGLRFITNPPSNIHPAATFGQNDEITIDFSGLTQYGKVEANAKVTYNNGNFAGALQDVSIGTDGKITGRYSNGDTKLLGQIPVVRFANPGGLEKMGDNLYAITNNSGRFDGVGEEAQVGNEKLLPGTLEMSNVDLASEFVDMITTQRGFQANSRIITTSDDMLQELVNLKR